MEECWNLGEIMLDSFLLTNDNNINNNNNNTRIAVSNDSWIILCFNNCIIIDIIKVIQQKTYILH
jgi:hypothetical protein